MLCIRLRHDNTVKVKYGNEELIISLLPYKPGAGVRLGFEGPREFQIVRSDAVRREPREVEGR